MGANMATSERRQGGVVDSSMPEIKVGDRVRHGHHLQPCNNPACATGVHIAEATEVRPGELESSLTVRLPCGPEVILHGKGTYERV